MTPDAMPPPRDPSLESSMAAVSKVTPLFGGALNIGLITSCAVEDFACWHSLDVLLDSTDPLLFVVPAGS